jgi:hypothetical protein
MRHFVESNGIRNNLDFSGKKPQVTQHDAHQGKPARPRKGTPELDAIARSSNAHGEAYEWIAQRILRDFNPTPPRTQGVDFVSRDGQQLVEVKGTLNGARMGTFSNIKVLDGELLNKAANSFLMVTPTHVYWCDADKLRRFVKTNYKKLDPHPLRYKKYSIVSLSILDLVNGGVLSTPFGDVAGWRLNPAVMERIALGQKPDARQPVLLEPLASRYVPNPHAKPRAAQPDWDEMSERYAPRESMKARHRMRRRGNGNSI